MAHFSALLAFLHLCTCGVSGVTTSGDSNDAKWIVQPTDYPYFVSLKSRGDCAGAIIGRRHVATAAHCLCPRPDQVKTLLSTGADFYPSKAYFNPECMFSCDDDGPNRCDVAIMEYEEDISYASTPLPIYPSSDEVGRELTILGYGNTGDANSGTCREGDGKMRRAKNMASSVEGSPGGVLKYTMDDNRGHDLEGMAQDGDSGGPAVINKGGTNYLAGVNSGTSEGNPCDFGSVDQYCRLSAHTAFISRVLNPSDNGIAPHMQFEIVGSAAHRMMDLPGKGLILVVLLMSLVTAV